MDRTSLFRGLQARRVRVPKSKLLIILGWCWWGLVLFRETRVDVVTVSANVISKYGSERIDSEVRQL